MRWRWRRKAQSLLGWPQKRTDRSEYPVTAESLSGFFATPEWAYCKSFMREQRDDSLRSLVVVSDPLMLAKLQSEVATLTRVIGDDPEVFAPLEASVIDECKERAREAEVA